MIILLLLLAIFAEGNSGFLGSARKNYENVEKVYEEEEFPPFLTAKKRVGGENQLFDDRVSKHGSFLA